MNEPKISWRAASCALLLALSAGAALAQGRVTTRNGDYILAVINQELVTAGEVDRRLERTQQEAQRAGAKLPPDAELRRQVVESLIEERVIITYARDSGVKIDDADLDRAVQSVATQNQINVPLTYVELDEVIWEGMTLDMTVNEVDPIHRRIQIVHEYPR